MLSRILLVEDDPALARQIVATLRKAGYGTVWLPDGDQALAASWRGFNLVILDLMLPGTHGFDVLKRMRRDSEVPVLILSARNDTHDKVRGLELGADDYLTKPFWPEELLARVKTRLRRPLFDCGDSIELGTLRLDFAGRRVQVDGCEIELTQVEFDLLAALARRAGAAVQRSNLVKHVLDPDRLGGERTLDVHMSRLRKKLGSASACLMTVWGVGYRLDAPSTA